MLVGLVRLRGGSDNVSAVISDCGLYRYSLTRQINTIGKHVAVGMVNPSTADATENDSTIRKLIGFGNRLGWASFTVFNKFAFRATDVNQLKTCNDPIGPMNDIYTYSAIASANEVIVAWGAISKLPHALRSRYKFIVGACHVLNKPMLCFGTCADGHPRHPVMIPYGEAHAWTPPMTAQGWE